MDLSEIRRTVEEWAQDLPEVRAVWLFGSRARGNHRPDSDIDIAVEIHDDESDAGTALAVWIFEVDTWRAALEPRLPWRLDLQRSAPGDDRVRPAVEREGILLYRTPG